MYRSLSRWTNLLVLVIALFASLPVWATDFTAKELQMKQEADDAFAASNLEDALKRYARLLHAHPDDNAIEMRVATCYYLMGVYDYATRHANNLVSRDSHSIDALMILVQVSLSNNHDGEAKAYLNAILSVNNQYAEAWRLLGEILAREGNETAAAEAMAKYEQYK